MFCSLKVNGIFFFFWKDESLRVCRDEYIELKPVLAADYEQLLSIDIEMARINFERDVPDMKICSATAWKLVLNSAQRSLDSLLKHPNFLNDFDSAPIYKDGVEPKFKKN